jgi:hypothetical protein
LYSQVADTTRGSENQNTLAKDWGTLHQYEATGTSTAQ